MAEGKKHRLSFKQLRLLFARGILRGRGSGKNRKVEYTKGASSGKADHSATRAARVAAGKAVIEGKARDLAKRLRGESGERGVSRMGGGLNDRADRIMRERPSSPKAFLADARREQAKGNPAYQNLAGVRSILKERQAKHREFLITERARQINGDRVGRMMKARAARDAFSATPRGQAINEAFGRTPGASKAEKLANFKASLRSAAKTRTAAPDYSATRAARVAAGKAVAAKADQGAVTLARRLKGLTSGDRATLAARPKTLSPRRENRPDAVYSPAARARLQGARDALAKKARAAR